MRTLGLLLLISGAAGADELPLLAAARKREAATRSIELVVRQTRTVPPGGFGLKSVPGPDGLPGPRTPNPEAEVRIDSTLRLVLDGSRSRYEDDSPMSSNSIEAGPKMLVACSDRSERGLFIPRPTGNRLRDHPTAMIVPVTRQPLRASRIRPLDVVLRLTSCIDPKGGPLVPTGTTAVIDGKSCEGYRLGKSRTLWVDPTTDYVVRWFDQGDYNFQERYDVRYAQHPTAGWLPAGWTETRQWQKSGNVNYTATAMAEVVRVGGPFADELFEPTFPAGTQVNDYIRKTEYTVGPNAEELPVLKEPVPPEQPDQARGGWAWDQWLGLAAVVVAAIAASGWWLRKRPRVGERGGRRPAAAHSCRLAGRAGPSLRGSAEGLGVSANCHHRAGRSAATRGLVAALPASRQLYTITRPVRPGRG